MPSELRRKSFNLHASQLQHDSFARRYNVEVAENQQERESRRDARIAGLVARNFCEDPDTGSLYIGSRSVNCENCVLGRTNGLHLTDYCSRSCFFCPQRRSPETCFTRQLNCHTPTEEDNRKTITTMQLNDSTGCGLSGGEPLIVYDKVLHYLRLLKEHMGKDFWIHLYTNGDYINRSTLAELKAAGLDEIRFDVAATDYNLEKVALSREYIPKVLIEIPVIPNDIARLQGMMFESEKLGIDSINFHEMVISSHNVEKLRPRGYIAAQPAYKVPFYLMNEAPVLGSEELILDLLELALTKQFSYGVHYCSYRARIIKQNYSKQYLVASKIHRPYEQVSQEGLLEKLAVSESGIAEALADLEKHQVPKEKIHLSMSKKRLETDKNYLAFLNPKQYEIAVVKTYPGGFFYDVSIEILE